MDALNVGADWEQSKRLVAHWHNVWAKERAEKTKLEQIIARAPNENDDLGSEFVHVQILKRELNDAYRELRRIADIDFRGNREKGSVMAHTYLKEKGEW